MPAVNARTLLGGIAVLLLLAVAAVAWYLNRPTPEEASIDNALGALEEDRTEALEDVAGTWTVDTTIGTFDFADATATFAGFRVAEELRNVGQTEAVGRTPAVEGTVEIEGTTLLAATITADLAQIVSDIPRRDDAMRRAMNVEVNPTATFTLTGPVDVGEVPAPGETISFTAPGELVVNAIPQPVTFEMEAQVAEGNLLVVGTAAVTFADHGIEAPQAGPVVSIEEDGTIEVQLWFTRA